MEILTYLRVLARRWPLVVATLAVALGLAYASAPRTKVYVAAATIVVGPRQLSTDPNRTDFSGDLANGLANLTSTYAVLIDSEVIATEAIRRSGVSRSPGGVVAATTATAVPSTQVLRVAVADPQPAVAQALATGMATAFVDRVTSFTPGAPPSVGAPPAVPVYLYQPAGLPVAPQPLGTRTRLATAGIFGLLAAVGVVLLLEHLDLSLRTPEDAERRLDLPVLGAIPLLAPSAGPAGTGPGRRPADDRSPA
jgi:capsular polysaccharide biosynthesis protein